VRSIIGGNGWLARVRFSGSPDDGQKILRHQARPADQSATDLRQCQDFRGITGLHRTTIKNARLGGGRPRPRQFRANEAVHRGDIVSGRDLAGADGPNRLIGDDAGEILRQAVLKLVGHDLLMQPEVTLLGGFADADDGNEPCFEGGSHLVSDERVRLALVGATLGMAKNNVGRPHVAQHHCGDLAGMGAEFPGVTVLAANRDAAAGKNGGNGAKLGCRGTDQHFGRGIAKPLADGARPRGAILRQSVHLPVSGDQWPHFFSFPEAIRLILVTPIEP
jgi:hypothetical protein